MKRDERFVTIGNRSKAVLIHKDGDYALEPVFRGYRELSAEDYALLFLDFAQYKGANPEEIDLDRLREIYDECVRAVLGGHYDGCGWAACECYSFDGPYCSPECREKGEAEKENERAYKEAYGRALDAGLSTKDAEEQADREVPPL